MTIYPVVILIEAQLGENIGACARAMKNFGLNSLRLVKPRDGWPNPAAEPASVGAIDLIKNTRVFDSVEEAIRDLEYVYATTGIKRNLNKPYVMTKQLTKEYPYNSKVGIMFGRENWGLNNNEIAIADKIITINTNPDFSSLNIAQAVLVVCYEIFKNENTFPLELSDELATKADIEHFNQHLFEILEQQSDFFKIAEKKDQMQRQIVNIFSKINNLSRKEVQILRGILKAIQR